MALSVCRWPSLAASPIRSNLQGSKINIVQIPLSISVLTMVPEFATFTNGRARQVGCMHATRFRDWEPVHYRESQWPL